MIAIELCANHFVPVPSVVEFEEILSGVMVCPLYMLKAVARAYVGQEYVR